MRDEGSVRVDLPCSGVYAMVSDVTRLANWLPGIERAEWAPDVRRVQQGAKFHCQRGGTRVTGMVESATPQQRFAFHLLSGGRPSVRWIVQIDKDGDGSRVTLRIEELRSQSPLAQLGRKLARRDQGGEVQDSLDRLAGALCPRIVRETKREPETMVDITTDGGETPPDAPRPSLVTRLLDSSF